MAQLGGISLSIGGIQLQQQIAGLDRLPFTHMDGLDRGGLHRLYGLDPIAWHHLALSGGHYVYLAKAGPEQGNQGKAHQQPGGHSGHRRDWRLLQRQRRR